MRDHKSGLTGETNGYSPETNRHAVGGGAISLIATMELSNVLSGVLINTRSVVTYQGSKGVGTGETTLCQ